MLSWLQVLKKKGYHWLPRRQKQKLSQDLRQKRAKFAGDMHHPAPPKNWNDKSFS